MAFLFNRQVAQIAEPNHIGVGRLAIHAYAAGGVIIHRGRVMRFAVGLHMEVGLLHQHVQKATRSGPQRSPGPTCL